LITRREALPELADCCAVTVVAESGQYIYGILARRA
jgi:hypothetical protein